MKYAPKTKIEKIHNFFNELIDQNNIEIDLISFIGSQEIESFEELEQILENNNGFNIEIIYYNNAINFLKNNDNSLMDSLEIAKEIGYTINDITSELLASLLASKIETEKFYSLRTEIENFFIDISE